ncbi:NAD(P)/FAD-dependent oxidoreductase [Roseibium sp.]|uniref:NAD(P)/FAD-dependent oxidoreductase n=1 Tax=Roseibium sp. TaxID=1936156 RepID=UPI003B520B54
MNMISAHTPATYEDALPSAVDFAMIGGGIIGLSAALALKECGFSVAVLEKGRVGGEQSSRNWGWIRKLGRDAAEIPLMIRAGQLWQDMETRVGASIGYREVGIIYLSRNDKEQAARYRHFETALQFGVPVERLSAAHVEQQIQGIPGYWREGIKSPTDARVEPLLAMPAIARHAKSAGIVIRENCAVRGLEKSAGKISGVICEAGTVRAGAVLLAGGSWTGLFLERYGIRFPQLSVRASVARTHPLPSVYAGCASDPALAFRREENGGYVVALTDHSDFFLGPSAFKNTRLFAKSAWGSRGSLYLKPAAPSGFPDAWTTRRTWRDDQTSPFEKNRVLSPAPWSGLVPQLQKRIAERFPALKDVEIAEAWAGMIDTMPDSVPTIDSVPDMEGLWVASGFSGHGFGIGPAVGEVLANLMQNRETGYDLTRFRFDRFTDGSVIEPGP